MRFVGTTAAERYPTLSISVDFCSEIEVCGYINVDETAVDVDFCRGGTNVYLSGNKCHSAHNGFVTAVRCEHHDSAYTCCILRRCNTDNAGRDNILEYIGFPIILGKCFYEGFWCRTGYFKRNVARLSCIY